MLGKSSGDAQPHGDASPLNREAVIDAALAMLDTVGVDGLSMRALAERLDVKAASLYWHLRDKGQLIELLAGAVLDAVPIPPTVPGWRAQATAVCTALTERLRTRPASADVVLASLPSIPRSRPARDLAATLSNAGVTDPDATATALVAAAVTAARLGGRPLVADATQVVTLSIDSGSYKAQVRAAVPGAVDLAASVGGGGAPTLDVQPDGNVIVTTRRGYRGAVELSPERTWYIKVHGGTWNTGLDLRGLRVSGIELDSGAGNVTCTLPPPYGVAPIRVNSGILNVTMHRPRGTTALATLHSGSVRVRLDGKMFRTVGSDVRWETPGASRSDSRYELTVHSGCVKVWLDDTAPAQPPPLPVVTATASNRGAEPPEGQAVSLILDGIERRLAS